LLGSHFRAVKERRFNQQCISSAECAVSGNEKSYRKNERILQEARLERDAMLKEAAK
jgi:hypothetical protein